MNPGPELARPHHLARGAARGPIRPAPAAETTPPARRASLRSVLVAVAVVLVSTGGAACRHGVRPTAEPPASPTPPPTAAPMSPAAASREPEDPALAALRIEAPARDLIDLAVRMGRIDAAEATAEGASSRSAVPLTSRRVGETARFWVHDIDGQRYFEVDARLAALSPGVAMWVEADQSVDAAALQRGADAFAADIVPRLLEAFGDGRPPGAADDDVHVLHHRNIPGVAGYFSSSDLLPSSVDRYSNRREMFYVNLTSYRPGSYTYLSLLAHEFQHMLHFRHDPDESVWVNEGMSELAAGVAGYGEQHGQAFFAEPDTALMLWREDTGANAAHYAAAYAFCAWLQARFGDEVLGAVVQDPANGAAGIESALERIGRPMPFDALFLDWVVANLVHDNGRADARYSYVPHDVDRVTAESMTERGAADTVEPYGTDYHDVTTLVRDGRIALTFSGDATVGLLDPFPAPRGRVWWSNVGESMDSRLTRAFDLRGATSARLDFRLWYDLETNWDYAYILASIDDGRTWQRLTTERTVDDDPNGNNYGQGLTGSSGGWVDETVDLSPFAGSRVTLRFEVVTDDAVSLPGMAIDDVRIDAAGFVDDAESDAGWRSEGWMRIDPSLPQRWGVQVIVDGAAGIRVEQVVVGADGKAHIAVAAIPADASVTLAISPLTPVTRVPAGYRVGVAR